MLFFNQTSFRDIDILSCTNRTKSRTSWQTFVPTNRGGSSIAQQVSLPQPEPEEESKPFVLDLKNFPDLANADTDSQNPNIQVSTCKSTHLKLVVISVKCIVMWLSMIERGKS